MVSNWVAQWVARMVVTKAVPKVDLLAGNSAAWMAAVRVVLLAFLTVGASADP
jgi:hypothetical protein